MDQDAIDRARREFGLTYHVNYAAIAERMVGLRGKKVLEVGGSLPAGFCIDVLGAQQWVAVDDPTYWEEIKEAATLHRPIGSVTDYEELPRHAVLTGAIEDLPASLHSKFDIVFSIAAFEHVSTLGHALECMFRALKPRGRLFTMFSPIWSAFDGHHIPHISTRTGEIVDLGRLNALPFWCHLIMRPPQFYNHLLKFTTPEVAATATRFTYHSPHINRLFTEGYVEYFKMSSFGIELIEATFSLKGGEGIDKMVEELRQTYPGRKYFKNNGLRVILVRPD